MTSKHAAKYFRESYRMGVCLNITSLFKDVYIKEKLNLINKSPVCVSPKLLRLDSMSTFQCCCSLFLLRAALTFLTMKFLRMSKCGVQVLSLALKTGLHFQICPRVEQAVRRTFIVVVRL